jgi:hypothetical protein
MPDSRSPPRLAPLPTETPTPTAETDEEVDWAIRVQALQELTALSEDPPTGTGRIIRLP